MARFYKQLILMVDRNESPQNHLVVSVSAWTNPMTAVYDLRTIRVLLGRLKPAGLRRNDWILTSGALITVSGRIALHFPPVTVQYCTYIFVKHSNSRLAPRIHGKFFPQTGQRQVRRPPDRVCSHRNHVMPNATKPVEELPDPHVKVVLRYVPIICVARGPGARVGQSFATAGPPASQQGSSREAWHGTEGERAANEARRGRQAVELRIEL